MMSSTSTASLLSSNPSTTTATTTTTTTTSTSSTPTSSSSSPTTSTASSSSQMLSSSSASGSPIMNDDSTQSSQQSMQLFNSVESSQQSSPVSTSSPSSLLLMQTTSQLLSSAPRYQTINLDGNGGNGGSSSNNNNNNHNANLGGEPELKKIKLTHYPSAAAIGGGGGSNSLNQLASSDLLNSVTLNNFLLAHKKLEERIGGILCCTVCLDLPSTSIYQCTNGHLMCAGCFTHLLADARLKDETPTCPNCRCEIGKTLCVRNLAVEKTLSELPASCSYCNVMHARNCLESHQRNECLERPTKCIYECIGCTWEGPYHELDEHSSQCAHPNKQGRDVMTYLKEKEAEVDEDQQSMLQLINYFSYEKVCFNDLQFKQYKTDEITPKLYFETNRFNAFLQQWVLKARINDNQKNPNLSLNRFLSFQLILKSKLSSNQASMDVKFCILKGPFGDAPISPRVHSFEFTQNKTETDYIRLNISSSDCNKLLGSKMINFRFFMFQP